MPILEVRALPPPVPERVPEILQQLCRATADALQCDRDGVWATWETIAPGRYVEGDRPASTQPAGTHPPLVRVLLFEGRPPSLVRAMLGSIARTLAASLGIEEGNVFVHVEILAAGTVHAGGDVLE